MSHQLSPGDFTKKVPGFYRIDSRDQIDYIAYFLTKFQDASPFTVSDISDVFLKELDIKPYSRLPQYLSEEARKTKHGKYIKAPKGYKLSGETFTAIQKIVEGTPEMTKLNDDIAASIARVTDTAEQVLLTEAAKCYQVKSNRAAMVMIWLVVLYHLHKHIFGNELTAFNAAISANPDKRLRPVARIHDFSDIKEVKLIELMRAAGIISNDVRKILDARLGERNSAAHPSTVVISSHKAVDFGLDLINNVLLKY